MTEREIAYKVLMDIEVNKNYSNIALNAVLKAQKIEDKSRGFITELVYGVIENQRYIDYMLNKMSKIKVKKMNYSVRTVLRMGVYQMIFLDKVEDYAAINESVKIMKKMDQRSSGFVNAVLRNIGRNKDKVKNINIDTIDKMAIFYSYETWIVSRLAKQYGKERTLEILKSLSSKPKLFVRVNRTKAGDFESFDALVEFIQAELLKSKVKSKRVELVEEALEVENFKRIYDNKMFTEGYISVQDISSMLVAKILDPKKGSKVIDVCAAPGGKTTHIAEIMEGTGEVVATDIHEHKIKLINNYSTRLGLENIEAKLSDASRLNMDYVEAFDYVLCDAPCSGMGIVRRKPEIKCKSEEEILELPEIQYAILETASNYVKPGGILLYSTCTMFEEENMNIVNMFLEDNEEFEIEKIEVSGKLNDSVQDGCLKILPDTQDMDGFFICRLKKI